MSVEIISGNFEDENGTKIWLCSEVLTDVFKLLTRRELVQHVQPAGLRFKKICDENVGSIHIIQNANQFIRELINQQNDAIQHYEALKGSKCKLAKQFRLSSFEILICNAETNDATPAKLKRRLLYQQCVMRHCIDLFRGCQVHLYLPGQKLCTTAHAREYFAYLNLLTPVQPAYIEVTSLGHNPSLEMEQLFKEPAILNCRRLTMLQASKNEPGAKAIFDWLHHSQIDEEIGSNSKNNKNEDDKVEEEEKFNNVRCLNIPNTSIANSIEEVMDRCIQNLNQSQSPHNRRHFVFSFWSQQSLTEFCIRNDKSGEVLVLENMKIDGVLRTTYYRLRRCLANELDGMEEFYEKMFNGFCKFQIHEEPGKIPPLVEIS